MIGIPSSQLGVKKNVRNNSDVIVNLMYNINNQEINMPGINQVAMVL